MILPQRGVWLQRAADGAQVIKSAVRPEVAVLS